MTATYVNDGTVTTAASSIEQDYTAYVDGGASFTINNGVSYTLATPLVTGAATFQIGSTTSGSAADTTLVLNAGTVTTGSTIKFDNAHATLIIGTDTLATIDIQSTDSASPTLVANPNLGVPLIGHFGADLTNFKTGDKIVIDTTQAAEFALSPTNSTVVDVVQTAGANINLGTLVSGTVLGTLTFSSAGSAAIALGNTNYLTDVLVQCFAAGTAIRTDQGDIAIQDLREGDQVWSVLTRRPVPVKWIGHRQVDCARHPRPETVWPVRIAADAFGPGVPVRYLFLSPDHAVYVQGVLVPVRYLVNGSTIRQEPRTQVTYYHVELARHDVLLAEGLPAESYLDTGSRASFSNGGLVATLFPDFSGPNGAGDAWEMLGCAPLALTGPVLESVRSKLAA